MVEPLKQYAKSKKPDTKDHIVHDPFIYNIQNREIHRDRLQGWGKGERERESDQLMGTGFPLG